ncbi:MAG: Na/Pi cotransporter family protein, partial [Bosea sp. (in: a-proteobacteria)]
KNAKRAAYAHISFNIIGVLVTIPLFFVSMQILQWVMINYLGGDPGTSVLVNGKETFPLIPVAVGVYSTFFNIFNTAMLFPFVGVFERVLLRVGHTTAEDVEDFSTPKYLDKTVTEDFGKAVHAVQAETQRHLLGGAMFIAIARGDKDAPLDPGSHHAATDILSRDIRAFTSNLFKDDMPYEQLDLVASLIEEADFTASLSESLHQVARRVKRETFGAEAKTVVDAAIQSVDVSLRAIMPEAKLDRPAMPAGHSQTQSVEELRMQLLNYGPKIKAHERGAILALLGSVERAQLLIERIDAERKSVNRSGIVARATAARQGQNKPEGGLGGLSPAPAA